MDNPRAHVNSFVCFPLPFSSAYGLPNMIQLQPQEKGMETECGTWPVYHFPLPFPFQILDPDAA